MSFIKRGAPGLRKRTDRRVTKPPESSPPLATRGVCHGIDTDKSAEIEHTWIHADTNTQAEETHTERHFQHGHKPRDHIMSIVAFVGLFEERKLLYNTSLKQKSIFSGFYCAGTGPTNTHTHTYTHIYVSLAGRGAACQSSSWCQQQACLCACPS